VRRKPDRYGFTSLELLISVALTGILLVMGVASLRSTYRAKARGADAAAQVLAGRFRAARAQAVASGVPVALVLPSAGGSAPHSQSCYLVSGDNLPRVQKVFNDSSERQEAVWFVGMWPGPTCTVNPPASGVQRNGFSAEGWYNSPDYQFIFTPSGALVTNNLPLFDGSYHVLVAAAATFSGASSPDSPVTPIVPAPGYFMLSEAAEPYTITLTQSGDVTVQRGAIGWAGPESPGLVTQVTPAQSPALSPATGQEPTLLGVDVLPDQSNADLPPGVDAVVRQGEYLTFTIRATDDDGGPLYASMAAEKGGTAVEGFSSKGKRRMQWNRKAQEWQLEWVWSPPPDDAVGTQYRLTCDVSDRELHVATLSAAVAPLIQKTTGGKFLLSGYDGASSGIYIVVNDDGSNFRRLPQYNSTHAAGFMPDGQYMFINDYGTIRLVSLDGSSQFAYPPTGANHDYDIASVTPDGSRFVVQSGGRAALYNAASGSTIPISSSMGNPYQCLLSRDGTKAAFYTDPGAPTDLWVGDFDAASGTISNEVYVTSWSSGIWKFSPDGTRLIGETPPKMIYSDGSPAVPLPFTLGTGNAFDWSPDGQRIAYLDTDLRTIRIIALDGTEVSNFQLPAPVNYSFLNWGR
jgi:type II secretory pathway pseudopilin PulG/sugar lactone lactonase YvrE